MATKFVQNALIFMLFAAPATAQDSNFGNIGEAGINSNSSQNNNSGDNTPNNNNSANDNADQSANTNNNQSINNAINNNANINNSTDDEITENPVNIPPANNAALPVNEPLPSVTNTAPFGEANLQPTPAPAPEPTAAKLPYDGQLALSFQFDQKGIPSLHTFVLHWAEPNGNIQSIDVLMTETNQLLQTIAIPQDRVHLVISDLTVNKNQIKDRIFEALDYNFDRINDIRLTSQWPYKVGSKQYLVWLYDESHSRYVLNDAISALPNPQPMANTQRIYSVKLGSYAGFEYERRTYSIDKQGRLRVQSLVKQTARDPKRNSYLRDVRIRIAGNMQRICKIVVPAEGVPKRLWGGRELCSKYLTKDSPNIQHLAH